MAPHHGTLAHEDRRMLQALPVQSLSQHATYQEVFNCSSAKHVRTTRMDCKWARLYSLIRIRWYLEMERKGLTCIQWISRSWSPPPRSACSLLFLEPAWSGPRHASRRSSRSMSPRICPFESREKVRRHSLVASCTGRRLVICRSSNAASCASSSESKASSSNDFLRKRLGVALGLMRDAAELATPALFAGFFARSLMKVGRVFAVTCRRPSSCLIFDAPRQLS